METETILVGPLPPPYYGQSVSFQMLCEAFAARALPHRVVNIAHSEKSRDRIGAATFERVVDYAAILARFAPAIVGRRKTVYLTIAQSRHGFFRDCVMIWAARVCGHRMVVHLKGGNYDNFYAAQRPAIQRLIRATLRQCDRVLVLGERLRGMFDFEPVLAARIRVVPNGLPQQEEPGDTIKTLPESEPIRLLFLSNLVESKGYLEVLEAVRLLKERLGADRIRCDFYGFFAESSADDVRVRSAKHAQQLFDEFVTAHDLASQVKYHGVAAGDLKINALRRAHFFLLPTRYKNEGQPVSIIEAMAYGNVVVSTAYRAIPDMVIDGTTGILIQNIDPVEIADRIEQVVRDPGKYAALSRAAVDHFRAGFTREAHLNRILPEIVGGTVAPRRGEAANISSV